LGHKNKKETKKKKKRKKTTDRKTLGAHNPSVERIINGNYPAFNQMVAAPAERGFSFRNQRYTNTTVGLATFTRTLKVSRWGAPSNRHGLSRVAAARPCASTAGALPFPHRPE